MRAFTPVISTGVSEHEPDEQSYSLSTSGDLDDVIEYSQIALPFMVHPVQSAAVPELGVAHFDAASSESQQAVAPRSSWPS